MGDNRLARDLSAETYQQSQVVSRAQQHPYLDGPLGTRSRRLQSRLRELLA